MNHNELLACLLIVERRVPDRHVTVDLAMAVAWGPDFARFHPDAGMRAAEYWQAMSFPSAGEFHQAVRDAAVAMRQEEEARYNTGQLALTKCVNGCDLGWIEEDPTSPTGTVRPCEPCRPMEYAVWRHRTSPNHDENHCPVCIEVRKGKRVPQFDSAVAQAADGGTF